jgi:hypothetical protein
VQREDVREQGWLIVPYRDGAARRGRLHAAAFVLKPWHQDGPELLNDAVVEARRDHGRVHWLSICSAYPPREPGEQG